MQIILVNDEGGKNLFENETKVKSFYRKWKTKTNDTFILPSTTIRIDGLKQLFPYIFIPHFVWVDNHGKVMAITSAKEINFQNIQTAIKGSLMDLPQKADYQNFTLQN